MKPITPSLPVRLALCAVIAVTAAATLYGLGTILLSQVYCRKAEASLKEGHFGLAANYLEKGDQLTPGSYRIKKSRGAVYYKLAALKTGRQEMISMYKKSWDFYDAALRLNPIDAETAYCLAKIAYRLEPQQTQQTPRTYLVSKEEGIPGQALPYFKKAIRLRPNGVSYRYSQLRYHYKKGLSAELESGVQALCRIYPRSFYHLRKEPFWSAALEIIAERGLAAAVAARIDPRNALMALASVKERAENWPAAIALYNQALAERAFTNKPGQYAHLSRLYIKTGDSAGARQAFLKTVRLSRDREKDLERLYHHYRGAGFPEPYLRFYQEARRHFVLPVRADILEARALIDLQRYARAKEVLEEVNRKAPEADAYYWLAKIGHATRDWDAMELAAQKATVYGPQSSRNYHMFAVSLQKQKKYPGAEKQAGLALQYAKKPNPWMFNQRAWIRWARKNYVGAVRDWKRAARLKPENPGFYAQIGEGYQKMGDSARAVQGYTKAVRLAPENERYRKRLQQLSEKAAVSEPQA